MTTPPVQPEHPNEADEQEAVAILMQATELFTPDELRGAAVALDLGTVDAMQRVPDRILSHNVVHRARTAGKLTQLADAFDNLTRTR